jgi:hypothetical protein
MEYWVFQRSITPTPHHSGSSIFHGIRMFEALHHCAAGQNTFAVWVCREAVALSTRGPGSRRFGRTPLHWFGQADLLRIDDFEMAPLIVEDDGLPVGADHEVISVRDHEGLPIAQHNPNGPERLGLHQSFDPVRDHALESSPHSVERQSKPHGNTAR